MKKTESKASNLKFEEMRLCVDPPKCSSKSKKCEGKKIVELPTFSGNDAVAWSSKAEEYFRHHSTPHNLKVPLVMACMEGTALHWFRFVRRLNPGLTWETLKSALLKRYDRGDSLAAESSESREGRAAMKRIEGFQRLIVAKQIGTVDEYIDEFVGLAIEIPVLTHEQYLGIFLNGLKKDVRVQMKVKDSNGILETMILAWVIERKIARSGTGSQQCSTGGFFPSSFVEDEDEDEDDDLFDDWEPEPHEQMAVLRYMAGIDTLEEYKQHFEDNDTPPGGGQKEGSSRAEVPRDEPELSPTMLLSLFVVSGTPPNTFKGVIAGKQLSVLISTATSHNFISNDIVRKFKLKVLPTEDYGVRLVSGGVVRSQGVCRNLKVKIGNLPVVADFYNLNLVEGVDAVLGGAWFETVGNFKMFNKQNRFAMSFTHQGREVEIIGEHELQPNPF